MSSLDAADLPRASFLRDPSRRYQGLSYNCGYVPQVPESRPLPPKRDSAVDTTLSFAEVGARHNSLATSAIFSELSDSSDTSSVTAASVTSSASTSEQEPAPQTNERTLALLDSITKMFRPGPRGEKAEEASSWIGPQR
ncbi:hypothetical protein OPT61_g8720 [Boeremia exigua]|uniref:Uncharacterized protein n=1 Tax=Boeremia exigua TaxID=749465 RepID=A0ACC2HXE9_9PLEO|nr:hypothetical protein OPT61_g8720 [Boeremia exigua]